MGKYEFTYNQEIGYQGQSLLPHFPGGKSGVTIGPGYDMSMRSAEQIISDLTSVGVDPEIAETLSHAAYKSGLQAQQWIGSHGGLYITEDQQRALFDLVLVPEYEERMISQINDIYQNNPSRQHQPIVYEQLSEHQKEILFDYTYNVGLSRFPTLVDAVLQKDWQTVSFHYERFSGDEPLFYRNEMFYSTFLSEEGIEKYENLTQEFDELGKIDSILDDMADDDFQNTNDISYHDKSHDPDMDELLDESHW